MPALRRVRRNSEDLNRQAAKIQTAGSGEGRVINAVLAERNPYRTNWQAIETIKRGNPTHTLNAVFPWDKSLRLEVFIDKSMAKPAFKALHNQNDEIEAVFGGPLTWEALPERQASRISLYMPGDQKREGVEARANQREWLLELGPKFAAALRPFIAALNICEEAPVQD